MFKEILMKNKSKLEDKKKNRYVASLPQPSNIGKYYKPIAQPGRTPIWGQRHSLRKRFSSTGRRTKTWKEEILNVMSIMLYGAEMRIL